MFDLQEITLSPQTKVFLQTEMLGGRYKDDVDDIETIPPTTTPNVIKILSFVADDSSITTDYYDRGGDIVTTVTYPAFIDTSIDF